MNGAQPGILRACPGQARYLVFSLRHGAQPARAIQSLRDATDPETTVVGIGQSLVQTLGGQIPELRVFPRYAGEGFEVPSTPAALWCWLRGEDRGELVHQTRTIQGVVSAAFRVENITDAFQYSASFDLTGYEDGTENPEGAKAVEAAILQGRGKGLDGSSFVAVQKWIHDLDLFDSFPSGDQDHIIGRRKSDNEELEDAPPSAHVKKTAQESFEPEAFILRRSMPWADEREAGLIFVAFGKSFEAFDALLKRMVGEEDGIPDALFRFTRPVSGSYFWCPPLANGKLDLRCLGL